MRSIPGSGPTDPSEAARRPSQDTRPAMLRLLVHEFLKQPIRGEAAEARFVTLAIRLIEGVDVPVAAKYVRELAPHPEVPRALALHLATAPLSIAGPFLRLSPVLDENDLATLAEGAAPSHLAAMAARRDVSPALAKRLAELIHRRHEEPLADDAPDMAAPDMAAPELEEGDTDLPPLRAPDAEETVTAITITEVPPRVPVPDEPAETVAVDPAAPHIPSVPAPAPELPAAEPSAPPAVSSISLDLVHIEIAMATDEPPSAPAPPAATIEEPAADEPAPALAASVEEPVAALPAVPDFFSAGPEERTALIARLVTLPPLPLSERPAAAPASFIDTLLEAAKAPGTGDLAALVERTLGVTPENAARIVADATGQSLAVVARALGLSFAILSRVLFRVHPVTGRSAEEMARLAEMFDSLPLASAQHLVASWRAGRRAPREKAEDAPSMRSYGNTYPAASSSGAATEGRQRNG